MSSGQCEPPDSAEKMARAPSSPGALAVSGTRCAETDSSAARVDERAARRRTVCPTQIGSDFRKASEGREIHARVTARGFGLCGEGHLGRRLACLLGRVVGEFPAHATVV